MPLPQMLGWNFCRPSLEDKAVPELGGAQILRYLGVTKLQSSYAPVHAAEPSGKAWRFQTGSRSFTVSTSQVVVSKASPR